MRMSSIAFGLAALWAWAAFWVWFASNNADAGFQSRALWLVVAHLVIGCVLRLAGWSRARELVSRDGGPTDAG